MLNVVFSRYHHLLMICFVVITAVVVSAAQHQPWHIDVGSPAARIFTTTLRESESALIDGTRTTFQWSLPYSVIQLPLHTQPQLITLRTIMRAESPPQAVILTHNQRAFALATTAGVRRYTFYATHSTQLTITCDMGAPSTGELANICIAIDSITGYSTTYAIDWPVLIRILVLMCAVAGMAWVLTMPAHPWYMLVCVVIGATLVQTFAVASVLFASVLSIGIVGIAAVIWGIRQWVRPGWQRTAAHAMVLNIALKGFGVLVPGYFGTDVFFHVNRFMATLSGLIYQIADGQGQTYPYTPGNYQLIAPLMIPLVSFIPAERIMIMSAIIIDSSTIWILGWICQRLAWSSRSIALMAWLYVILPAGFLLEWQATIAQNIGQWLGMMAIATSLFAITPTSVLWIMWAVVGHFGAFLSLHLAMTIAAMYPQLRHMVRWWWGGVLLMGVVFYSQYSTLIRAQLMHLGGNTANLDWTARWWQFAWEYGIYGHYLGIGLALCLVGICVAPRDRWWFMAVAMLSAAGALLLAQVFVDFGATRYIIFVFPVVASYAGMALARLRRGRAGHVMLVALLAVISLHSILAWFNGTLFGIRMGYLW